MKKTIFGPEKDHFFMQEALNQARKALEEDEVPIGAVVVNTAGDIIGRGYNKVMAECTQAAHAEIRALEQAGKAQGDWRLEDCLIYITLEPCAMCMNLIKLSRLAGVLYAASSPLFGYSQQKSLDKMGYLPLYKEDTVFIKSGIEVDAAIMLLRQFFKQKRNDERGAST
jgi:tRNA(adenine34) deaminase